MAIQTNNPYWRQEVPVAGQTETTQPTGTNLSSIQTQIQNVQNQIPAIQQGIVDVSTLGQVGNLTIPVIPGIPPDLTSANAGIAGKEASLTQMLKDYQDQMTAAMEAYTKQQQGLLGKYFGDQKSIADIRAGVEQSLGIDASTYFTERKEDLAEIQALKEDYDKAVAQKDQELANIEAQPISMDLITRKMTKAEKDANIRLSLKAAQINTKLGIMEAKDQSFDKAQQYINQAVDDYTKEQQLKVQEFQQFYDLNRDIFSELKSDYQNVFNLAWQQTQTELDNSRNDYNQIMAWVVQYPEADWPSDLSKLTVEDAARIAGQRPITKTTSLPTSYKEWQLAGGEEETGMSYTEWMTKPSATETKQTKETLTNLIAQVNTYESREMALADLEKNKTAIMLQVGQNGYNQIIDEVNRIFPPSMEEVKTTEKAFFQNLWGVDTSYMIGGPLTATISKAK